MNPVHDFAKVDFKTMNNEVLIKSLAILGVEGEASGRNDLHVNDRKVSGSAYKLKLGKSDGTGRRSLHHGTMLLDLELGALGKYLSPSKAKLESKGVDSVISRVLNLKELVPEVSHEVFCQALEDAFIEKWSDMEVNRKTLKVEDLEKIPKLMEIYESSSEWEWRFGQTPEFKNSLEKKFPWALIDVQFDVNKGKIEKG